MNGVLLIDKPEGPTSAEVVRRVRRVLASTRIGHLGTLDPFACGVLPLCVGEATKIAQFLNAADKEYEGVICLGAATDTGDRTGTIVRTADVADVADGTLADIARRFTGEYRQVPPMYSAIKRDGVPLYELARRGIEVERPARCVHIASLELTRRETDRLGFRVSCSKGTYIRVLAQDIGEALGSVAHVESLCRTRFGGFKLENSVPLRAWSPESRAGWVTIREALAPMPAVMLDEGQTRAVRHGQNWVLGRLDGLPAADHVLLLDPRGLVTAVISRRNGRWVFARVMGGKGPTLQGVTPVVQKPDK